MAKDPVRSLQPLWTFIFPITVFQPDLLVICDPAQFSERSIEGVPDYLTVESIEKLGVLLTLEGRALPGGRSPDRG